MATQQWKHHVFISFRGEDTRYNFVCHLDKALSGKGLKTFVDNQLQRGEEINTALLQAIQDSKVALIIFSENYASSSWCLDELLKIIECHETHNQIVIPVFYRVNPSDVRKQNGSFEESFAEHIKNRGDFNKIQKWKAALTKAAIISGMGPDANREDNKLIDQIVSVVLEKLNLLGPCSFENFVGLDSKISKAKKLLATGSSDVCMLGICGMGGIGKTTIAGAIFDEVSSQFVGRCFVRNVREVSQEKEGMLKLLQQLISDLLEERDVKNIYTENVIPALRERLKSKKVFVVFDDVSDRLQLQYLTGNQSWFGAGSNIIITSRDKQVFKGITDNIYDVEALSDNESCQLFVRNAQPSQDHIPLIGSFVNYAGGNPLAIKVLGSYVCGKEVKIWRDALNKLSKCPNQGIQNVLKLSYDGLDREEQAIFLHIACFFKGENIDEAKRIFSICGLSADVGVSVLVDKSLVTISENDVLDMHDLLQEMGREIVRQESIDDPRGRTRLWDAEDIRHVFQKDEGTEAMKTQFIILNTSQIRDDIEIDPNVFKRMLNLKVLRFYTSRLERSKLHLTEHLPFLPSGLRYLHWDGYPSESLPTGFHAKELVVLDLPNSNIKQIWEEVKGNIKVPPSSRQFFSKITSLDMSYCQNLKSFPNNVDLQSLEILSLWGCSNLEKFPDISTNLRKLDVVRAAIEEVHPSSIERLSKLEKLNMQDCGKLKSLPNNICNLQALQKLNLGFCKSLKEFPEILEPMDNLRKVYLPCSGIEAIPFSKDNMKRLEFLYMPKCLNLACFPESFGNFMREIDAFVFSTACKQRKKPTIPNFRTRTVCEQGEKPCMVMDSEDVDYLFFQINCRAEFEAEVTIEAPKVEGVDVPSHVSEGLSYLIDLPSHPCLKFFSPCSSFFSLDLSVHGIRELPKDLGTLYYLRELNLRYNDFVEIPASIKQLPLLESLLLDGCPKLRSLPQLPTSLCRLSAPYCESLETLLASKQPIFKGGNMDFTDCFKLEEKECEFLAYKLLRNGPKNVQLRYPGNRIPELFKHQTTGDIIRIKFPSKWFFNRRFFGFAFCIVMRSDNMLGSREYFEFECCFEDNYNPTIRFTYQTNCRVVLAQQHVLVWCVPDFNDEISKLFRRHCFNMASFKFFIRDDDNDDDDEDECYDYGNAYWRPKSSFLTEMSSGKIEKCGITPLYMRDDDDDENAYWMLQSSFLTEMSTNEDDEEDVNSGDAVEVCSLRLGLGQMDLEQTEMFHELTEKRKEKRKATVEAGSKIKRKREPSA